MSDAASSPILFFDGVCNFCNSSVQFIIRHDKDKKFRFASLQSELGKNAIREVTTRYKVAPDSLILHDGENWYVRSSAALYVCKILGGPWKLLFAAIIVPRFLRDAIYDVIARNRYRWFGKKDACMIPTPDVKDRFLN
jgi:predicted DCC family thiol-disulfide oxidoreductase YuxK